MVQIENQPELITRDLMALLAQIQACVPENETITVHVSIRQTGIGYFHPISRVWQYRGERDALFQPSTEQQPETSHPERFLPFFYAEMRKRLQSHFSRSERLVAALALHQPKEACFLRKVNTIVEKNLDREGFDVGQLSAALCMSRVQLYRKLKLLIRQTPAEYIKLLRLQKAKELLETTDLRIGEIACKTGFQSQSHFTRVFTGQYDMPPSLFSRSKKM